MSGLDDRRASQHLDDARCTDAVLGLLDDEARASMLRHVAGCAECAARLRAHAAAAERAQADWRSRSAAGPAPVTPLPVRRPPALRRALVATLAAAAVVAVMFAVPLLRTRPVSDGSAPWLADPGELVRVREGAASDPRLASGLQAYARRDLAAAERDLEAAQVTGSAAHVRALYLAQVRHARGDAAGALDLLRHVAWDEVPEPWRRDGLRLLARALRAAGQGAAADTIEHALRTLDPGILYQP